MSFKLIAKVCVTLILLLVSVPEQKAQAQKGDTQPALRTWVDSTGQHRVQAVFLDFSGGNGRLRREDGKTVSVPMEKLSGPDQEYVKQRTGGVDRARAAGENPFSEGAESEIDRQTQQLCEQIVKTYRAEKLGAKPRIAVVEFSDLSGHATYLGQLLSEELITKLFSTGNYNVVERFLIKKALAEHNLAVTGFVDPDTAKKLGQIVGADAILSGTIADLGNSLRVNARLMAVETADVLAVAAVTINKAAVPPPLVRPRAGAPGRVPTPGPKPQSGLIFHEDFARYKEGDHPGWGQNVYVKKGLDNRNWLCASLDGSHTVGQKLQFPEDFFLEFDLFAQIPRYAPGLQGGMLPAPARRGEGRALSNIRLIDQEGEKYDIEWSINRTSHTFTLRDGAKSSIYGKKTQEEKFNHRGAGRGSDPHAWWKTGTVRIEKVGNTIKVKLNDELALAGDVSGFGRFAAFKVDVYKRGEDVYARYSNSNKRAEYIFFTDFKVGPL